MADYPGGVPASGGGSGGGSQTAWQIGGIVKGWASGATLNGSQLSGPTPDSFDGLAKSTFVSTFFGGGYLNTIFIPDGGAGKIGLYTITSLDLTNMVLTKVSEFGDGDEVVFPMWGDTSSGGGCYHYNPANDYAAPRQASSKTLLQYSSLPRRIVATTIFFENLAGTLAADGKTLTLSTALTTNDGWEHQAGVYPFLLLNGQSSKIQNGLWIATNSTTLVKAAWFDSPEEVKNYHEIVIVGGRRWRKSVWQAKSADDAIDPATSEVEYVRLSAPNDDRSSFCVFHFLEGVGSVIANDSIFAPGVGMDGTLTGVNPDTWWQDGGPLGTFLTIPGGGLVEISEAKAYRMDTYDHLLELWFKTATTTGVRLLDRSDGDGAWESAERYLYVTGSGDIGMEFWGVASLYWTSLGVNDDLWHHLEMRGMLVPGTSDIVYAPILDGRPLGGKKAAGMSTSDQNHGLRIGHAGSSDALSVAGFRLENLGRR